MLCIYLYNERAILYNFFINLDNPFPSNIIGVTFLTRERGKIKNEIKAGNHPLYNSPQTPLLSRIQLDSGWRKYSEMGKRKNSRVYEEEEEIPENQDQFKASPTTEKTLYEVVFLSGFWIFDLSFNWDLGYLFKIDGFFFHWKMTKKKEKEKNNKWGLYSY